MKYSRLFPQNKFQIRDRLGIKLVQISFSPQPSVDTEIKDGSYNFLQEYNKLSLANHCRLKQSFDSVSLLYTLSESWFFYLTFFSISGHSRYFYTFVICSNSSRCVTSSWCCVIVNNCSLAHKRTPQAPSTKMRPPCTSC